MNQIRGPAKWFSKKGLLPLSLEPDVIPRTHMVEERTDFQRLASTSTCGLSCMCTLAHRQSVIGLFKQAREMDEWVKVTTPKPKNPSLAPVPVQRTDSCVLSLTSYVCLCLHPPPPNNKKINIIQRVEQEAVERLLEFGGCFKKILGQLCQHKSLIPVPRRKVSLHSSLTQFHMLSFRLAKLHREPLSQKEKCL